jgi:hypothetical protein
MTRFRHLPGLGWRREGNNAEAEPDLEYVDLVAHPELEPDLGPTLESIEQGAQPDDAPYIDHGFLPDGPEVEDVLDTAYGAAQARRQLAAALAAAREPEPDPEAEIG